MGLTRLFKEVDREDLQGIKSVRINGHRFRIRKVNALLDFPPDRMPMIFSNYLNKRKPVEPAEFNEAQVRRHLEDMKIMVQAGLVEPKLSPEILTLDDIFRWGDTGAKLYMEILTHSLNHFRGVKGVFFSIAIRRSLFITWRKTLDELQLKSSFPTAVIP